MILKSDMLIVYAAHALHGRFTREQMRRKLNNHGWKGHELSCAFRRLKKAGFITFSNQGWKLNPGWDEIIVETADYLIGGTYYKNGKVKL